MFWCLYKCHAIGISNLFSWLNVPAHEWLWRETRGRRDCYLVASSVTMLLEKTLRVLWSQEWLRRGRRGNTALATPSTSTWLCPGLTTCLSTWWALHLTLAWYRNIIKATSCCCISLSSRKPMERRHSVMRRLLTASSSLSDNTSSASWVSREWKLETGSRPIHEYNFTFPSSFFTFYWNVDPIVRNQIWIIFQRFSLHFQEHSQWKEVLVWQQIFLRKHFIKWKFIFK